MNKERYYDAATGRLYQKHTGCIPIVHVWTTQMLSDLRRWYATTTNAELADLLGVSVSTVRRKARTLRLQKDAGWLNRLRCHSLAWATAKANRHGNRGRFKPGNRIGSDYYFKHATA